MIIEFKKYLVNDGRCIVIILLLESEYGLIEIFWFFMVRIYGVILQDMLVSGKEYVWQVEFQMRVRIRVKGN